MDPGGLIQLSSSRHVVVVEADPGDPSLCWALLWARRSLAAGASFKEWLLDAVEEGSRDVESPEILKPPGGGGEATHFSLFLLEKYGNFGKS